MSLKAKLISLCMFITMVGLCSGIVGYIAVDKVAVTYSPLAIESLPLVESLGNIRGTFLELRVQVRSIALEGSTKSQIEKYTQASIEKVKSIDKLIEEYRKLDKKANDRSSFKELTLAWSDFKEFGGVVLEKTKNYENNKSEVLQLIREVCPVKAERFYQALVTENKVHLTDADNATADALATEKSSRKWTVIISISALFVAGLASYLFSEKLSLRISTIAQNISVTTKQVTSSVASMSHSGEQLSEASTASAATLEETVASLEELTSMVRMNTENAKQAAEISSTSKEAAEKGEKDIQKLISSMHDISESSKKIEDIITVIDDIAFQTNLLALNAAVEAARAGEQGKGFAVVAEAVRTLALRSASAAKDISDLIKDSSKKVEAGSSIADESGIILHNIVSSVKKVSDLNLEISAASIEQANGIQHISVAMNQLDQSVQGNAASAEEIAASSQEINGMAKEALDLVTELDTVIVGKQA